MRSSDFNGNDEHDSRAVIDRIKSNLHVLWNDTTQASKDLWRHWYVGAHDMVTERMKAHYPSAGRAAMTAVYAAMSPNTMSGMSTCISATGCSTPCSITVATSGIRE